MFFQQIHIDHPLTDQQKGKELVLDVSMKLDLPATDIQFGYHSAEYYVIGLLAQQSKQSNHCFLA